MAAAAEGEKEVVGLDVQNSNAGEAERGAYKVNTEQLFYSKYCYVLQGTSIF